MSLQTYQKPSFTSAITGRVKRVILARIGKILPDEKSPKKHFMNACAWFIHGEIKTRVVFYNYFWRNHHEEILNMDIQLFDKNGQEIWKTSRVLLQDETFIIDSQKIENEINLADFEGNLVLSCLTTRVPEELELIRFNVDYYTASGFISTVHDQAIFWPSFSKKPHSLGKMEVVETAEIGTALIFVNSLSVEQVDLSFEVTVFRNDGQSIRIGSYQLPPRGLARIELGREQPELEKFLGGKPGQVVVESEYYIKRAAVLHYRKRKMSDWFSVNHSEEYRGKPPYISQKMSVPSKNDRKGPMSPMPFFHKINGITTDLVVFNDLVETDQQVYGLSLYDNQGELVFQKDDLMSLPVHGTGRIKLTELLPENKSVFGLAQIYLAPSPYNKEWAFSFPADAHYILNEGAWDAMYSQGSYPRINSGEGSRSRVFSRVYYNDFFQTDLILFYAGSGERAVERRSESSTKITLSDPSGNISLSRVIHLKPFSSLIVKVDELFPEIKTMPQGADRAYGIYVRDSTAKIIVIHMTRNSKSTALAADHFYGG